jgi:hypothetical protein
MRNLVAALFAVLAIAVVAAGCGGGGDSTGGTTAADTGSSSSESSESGSATEESGAEDEGAEDEEGTDDESATEDEGGADETESGSAPTKAAFIKEADKICTAAEADLVKELTDYAEAHGISTDKEPNDDQKVELTEEVVLPNLTKQAEELEGLTPPAGDEAKIEEMTSALSGALAEAEDNPTMVLDGDLLDEASEKAEAYGLTECG